MCECESDAASEGSTLVRFLAPSQRKLSLAWKYGVCAKPRAFAEARRTRLLSWEPPLEIGHVRICLFSIDLVTRRPAFLVLGLKYVIHDDGLRHLCYTLPPQTLFWKPGRDMLEGANTRYAGQLASKLPRTARLSLEQLSVWNLPASIKISMLEWATPLLTFTAQAVTAQDGAQFLKYSALLNRYVPARGPQLQFMLKYSLHGVAIAELSVCSMR